MLSSDRDNSRRTLLTVPEVAAELGCGRTLVYGLIGARQLPVVKIGRLTRIPAAAVDDFVSRRAADSTASFPPLATHVHRPRTRSKSGPAAIAGSLAQGQLSRAGLDAGQRRYRPSGTLGDPTALSRGASATGSDGRGAPVRERSSQPVQACPWQPRDVAVR